VRESDMVYVEKGGEIIPKIVGVNLEQRSPESQKVVYIQNCPECGTKLVRKEGEASHYCPNEESCPPQIKGKIEHFISRKAMNIDSLGEGKVEMLFDKELIKNVADLYDLNYDKLIGLEKTIEATGEKKEKKLSFKEKTVNNILNGLEESKKIPFEKVLFALGIRYVGQTVSKKLARHYQNMDALIEATFEDLVLVDEIGDKIAESLILYFAEEKHIQLINRLKASGLQFEMEKSQLPKSSKLEGLSIIASGKLQNFSRDEIKKAIEENGGKAVTSISKKTSYLLAGENIGPNKLAKARELNIPIMTEEEFLGMIG